MGTHRASVRSLLLPCAALALLAGCSDPSGDSASPGPDEPLAACGGLTDHDVASLVGVATSGVDDEQRGESYTLCNFNAIGPDGPTGRVLTVSAHRDERTVQELAEDPPTGSVHPDAELATTAVEVPGADEALLTVQTVAGLTGSARLVARADDISWEVAPVAWSTAADEQLAIAAMTAMLTGEVPAEAVLATEPLPDDACSTWSDELVAAALGTPVRSQATGDAPGSCLYGQRGDRAASEASVSVIEQPGATRVASLLQGMATSGVQIEQVAVEGTAEAWITDGAPYAGTVSGYLATPTSLRTVVVTTGTRAAAERALRELLATRLR